MHLRNHAAASTRHGLTALAEAALIVAIAAALTFATAVATGHGPAGAGAALARGGSAIWIDQSSYRSAGELSFGQDVNFGYRSDSATSIQLHCFQPAGSDRLVFADSRMLTADGWGYGTPFYLGPSGSWTEGAASCKAMLGNRSQSGKYRVEATVSFDVEP